MVTIKIQRFHDDGPMKRTSFNFRFTVLEQNYIVKTMLLAFRTFQSSKKRTTANVQDKVKQSRGHANDFHRRENMS